LDDIDSIKAIPIMDIADRLGLNWKPGKVNPCFKGHGNRTGCLSVTPEKNLFHCFSCGIGGTGIDLVMQYLNLDTAGALQWLKTQYGIQDHYKHPVGSTRKAYNGTFRGKGYKTTSGAEKTPYKADIRLQTDTRRDGREYAGLYRAFVDMLPLQEAAEYLKDRGLSEDIIRKSGIRALPKDFDYKPLKDLYGIETLLKAGLFALSKAGNPYPVFFRHRLIIPFFDMDGETILLLQGRNIDSTEEPKYKFLPGIKTVVYNLKGLADAERSGKEIYITEGVIDCLSCYQLGMLHPIAIGGATNTAIYEPEVFNRLGKLEVTIATDRDKAGQKFYRDFVKRYKHQFLSLPNVINWNRIQGAKDINDILKNNATLSPERPQKERYYSEIVDDIFTVEDNGGALFESGVYYTPAELRKIEKIPDSGKKPIHVVKKLFQGTLQ